ncbi:ATP-dependent Clp protease adaptor ClpS [uncultured Campylobacter sp.]|uniref:ATP-dependent Clp protease adaptor ClpS n=1 Tax=uncultured Campylobacter sp. TaxID=218934 RepID=UPI0026288617|nr:ATP-dependent Clp protease adaptor ClpS [uncultured Campylobacter sp.]
MNELQEDISLKLDEPKMFKVLLLNDDVTTMDFVVQVLMDIFHYDIEKASRIMLEIHHLGKGLCGVYTQEIALSKQRQVINAAMKANFPLRVELEEE